MKKKDAKNRIREEMRADQAAYDARTKRLKEYLERHGVPTDGDQASYDARTRRLEAAIASYADGTRRRSS